MKKRALSMMMTLIMIITCLVSPSMASPAGQQNSIDSPEAAISQTVYQNENGEFTVETAKKNDTQTKILVCVGDGETVFLQTSDLELAVASSDEQQAGLYAAESAVVAALGEEIVVDHYFSLVFNGFSFTGESWMIDAINQIDGLYAMEVIEFQLVEPEADEETIDLTPAMSTATSMVGAVNAWDLGYTGKGMAVGVIDTGIKQTHEAFSVAPEGAKITKEYLENVFSQYGDKMHGKNPEGAYYSAKLPYNWDYFDEDHIPNHPTATQNHGTHVAGIVAGNNGDDFKGVAPDAQIVPMQVFNKQGGGGLDDIMAAMEDAVYLGLDAINLSLGIANGFEDYSWPMNFEPVYDALEKAGVAVCVAASNDKHSYIDTSYGDWGNNLYRWPAANPDNSHLGNPGTFVGSFTVGNTTNVNRDDGVAITLNGATYPVFNSTGNAKSLMELGLDNHELVYVGLASADELTAAGDLTGKIALVQRGSLSVTSRCTTVANAGAAAILFYNNVQVGPHSLYVNSPIPYGCLSLNDGEALVKALIDNRAEVKLIANFDYSVASMVTSSSWGPTARLHLKPDISAPGDKIISADGTTTKGDDVYVSMTGTSMATPAVAGGILLLKEYLKTQFPDATAKELTEKAYALMMSTAGQATAFVRQQGAGVMDMEKALKTKVYMTTTEGERPKLELDDSENGEFPISFKLTNFGTTDKTYSIGVQALTEQTSTLDYKGRVYLKRANEEWVKKIGIIWTLNPTAETVSIIDNTIKDVSDLCILEGDKEVTVKAGETITVNLTLKAGEELMEYFRETCPSGMYLEGWLKLADKTTENKANLTIPFLGFVGDWDYPAMIDEGYWWQNEYGVNNLSMLYGSNGNKGGIFLGYGDVHQGLGLNYYWDCSGETYLADRNALSPDGDGRLDALTSLEFSILRQPKQVRMYIQYADGDTKTLLNRQYYYRKEDSTVSMKNECVSFSSLDFYENLEEMEDGETANFVLEVYLDHPEFQLKDNKLAKVEIPFTKDLTAPVVKAIDGGVEIQDTNYVAYYAVYTDARHTDLVFEDGVFAMERGVKETYLTDMDKYFVAVADYARNEAFYYVEDGVAYELDGEGFDHGRTIIGQSHMVNIDNAAITADTEFAWYSLSDELDQLPMRLTEPVTESEDLTAHGAQTDIINVDKAADGTIYASSLCHLYTFDPVTLEKKLICKYNTTENYRAVALMSFAVRPGTNELYGLAFYNFNQRQNVWFSSIDPETGNITRLWQFDSNSYRTGFDFVDENRIVVSQLMMQGALEFRNYSTGAVESSVRMYMSGVPFLKNLIGGTFGYGPAPILYDDVDNCVYFGGCWGQTRDMRIGDQILYKYDIDTGEKKLVTNGYNGGIGLYGLFFLDEFVDIPQQEHICYIKETVAPTCTTEGYTLRVCAECGKEFKENVTEAKGHDYEAVVTAPTCTTLGYTTYTCANCGDTYKDDYTPNTDHKYGQWQTVKEATCTEKGQEKRTCECGAEEFRDVDVKGHDYKKTVTEPTCTTMGYTTYTCSVCGDTYKSDYVDAKGHDYKKTVTEPTCTEMGYTTYTCSVCKDTYKSDFTAPVAHKYGDWETVTAPTCTTEGQEKRTCSCGAAEYRSTGKVGHKYESVVTEPTCTAMGYTTYTCSVCQDTYKTDFVAPVAHKYTETVTAPTCTEMGYTTYTCACGDTYKDNYVAPTGHKYGDWETVKEATCTAKGQEKRSCACGAAEYRDTDMIAHKYAETVTAPTCTDMGYTTYTCAACGHSYASDYVAPTGHKFGDWEVTKESTCTEKGEEQRVCTCGETETRATDKADHVFEDVVTAPTCTEVGYTNHVCTVCGHNYITDLTQATGHDYEATVTAPTCTEDGYTTYTCTVCGESYVDDIVPATGHTFGEWVLTTEPGCTEAGEETRYCADCDATETREVAPVCPAEKFTDVDTKQWYHEGVCYVIRNGLMNGKSETVFAPNANLTRAELVTVLYRMAGEPSVEDLEHPFTDVADDTWYTDAVIWTYNAEVVKGISETAFAPNANITREQIATILYRYAGAEEVEEDALADFADAAKVNNYAVEAMNWAVSVGLINGVAEGELAPQGNATRAQIATILMRYCEG